MRPVKNSDFLTIFVSIDRFLSEFQQSNQVFCPFIVEPWKAGYLTKFPNNWNTMWQANTMNSEKNISAHLFDRGHSYLKAQTKFIGIQCDSVLLSFYISKKARLKGNIAKGLKWNILYLSFFGQNPNGLKTTNCLLLWWRPDKEKIEITQIDKA